jgi:DNA-binding LacI/PurR family transcriptional regulator
VQTWSQKRCSRLACGCRLRRLFEQRVADERHARGLGDWKHLSGIKIDYFSHKPELHNVTNNPCDIIRLAMQRVIAAGYRRIGFVMHRGWDHSMD